MRYTDKEFKDTVMGKKETLTLSVEASTKQRLESLASELGYIRGSKPNMSGLVEAIAMRELAIGQSFASEKPEAALQELLVEALSKIDFAHIARFGVWIRPLLEENYHPEVDRLLDEVNHFQDLMTLIEQRRPFKLFYQDAAGTDHNFSIYYAQISLIEDRNYLECWCAETEGNRDIPGLQHNWSFRPDRIVRAGVIPLEGKWRSQGLDTVEAEFLIYDGLAHAYESIPGDKAEWVAADPPTRKVIRPITSSFWFLRKVLPFGSKCKVLGNKDLRGLLESEIEALRKNYERMALK
jgi:predicted DNA-binding transcriptional regulator YafY